MKRRNVNAMLAGAATLPLLGSGLPAQDTSLPQVTVGVQLAGTARWEMQTIIDRGLDAAHGFRLVLRDVAGKQAGHVALLSGTADIILSDYIWVARLRRAGEGLTAVPHSLAVGGLMTRPGSGIASARDLPGRRLGIAGGPVDKSWVVLQAHYARLSGEPLDKRIEARFGPPPLINALLDAGDLDASLNFWHFNARAKAAGMTEVISVARMLSDLGIDRQPPLLSWAFLERTARSRGAALRRFFDASFAAKDILRDDDAAWDRLRPMMGAQDDDALFETLRADYRAGIVPGVDAALIGAAGEAFALMAEHGGPDLVGDSAVMDPGTFWSGFRHEG